MKKWLVLIVSLALCISLAACGGESGPTEPPQTEPAPVDSPKATEIYACERTSEVYETGAYNYIYMTQMHLGMKTTVTLKGDGTYEVKKAVNGRDIENAWVIFTGTYSRDGNTAVLSAATYAQKNLDYGNYASILGQTEKANSEEDPSLLNYFPTSFLTSGTVNGQQVITLNADGTCVFEHDNCKHESHDAVSCRCSVCNRYTTHDVTDGTCSKCDFTTEYAYDSVPEAYLADCPEKGTVEKIEYKVEAYAYEQAKGLEEGSVFADKELYVYVPYGYDDTKQYDIVYLLHGMGGSAATWLVDEAATTCAVLDNLIYTGKCDPVIIVTPTYYLPAEYETEGVTWLHTQTFAKELRNDIIPLVEGKYSTYADGDTSEETLAQTRRHRAMAGLSMGSRTTFDSGVMQNLDVLGYFGCFSGATDSQKLLDAINSESYKDLDVYYLYVGNGTADSSNDGVMAMHAAIQAAKNPKLTEGENYALVNKLDHIHDFKNWIIDLYNVLSVSFFKD